MQNPNNSSKGALRSIVLPSKTLFFVIGFILGISALILIDYELNSNHFGVLTYWVSVPIVIGILTSFCFNYLQTSTVQPSKSETLPHFLVKEGEPLENKFNLGQLNLHIQSLKDRFTAEIDRLILKSTISLSVGITTSLIGVFLLWYNILDVMPETDQIEELISFTIPRFIIILLVEVVSFFLFKTYHTSLMEIKYYQNEITNVEYKAIALNSAIIRNDEDSLRRIIQNILQSDKNSKSYQYY